MHKEHFNVYCDESSHLLNDHLGAMALGCVWTPYWHTREASARIKDIKRKHGLSSHHEVKWNGVSPSKLGFYLDLVDYFFDENDLMFRVLIIPDKSVLRHDDFEQDHDSWYYKMYFLLLKNIISTSCEYSVYLDIKDTHGGGKVRSLSEVLANSHYDFSRKIVKKLQVVRSDEAQLLQLCDLMIGAVASVHRKNTTSDAKLSVIERIRQRSGRNLTMSTLPSEQKFNVFVWKSRDA